MQSGRSDQDDETVPKAMGLIDPSGNLVPGTELYDLIREMIIKWIDGCGPDNALYMARQGARHFDKWIKCRR
jgi:hypothetical protein